MTMPAQAEATRAKILGVSRSLFIEQGYRGTTIADIAKRLGMTTAALYYHFRSTADAINAHPGAGGRRHSEGRSDGRERRAGRTARSSRRGSPRFGSGGPSRTSQWTFRSWIAQEMTHPSRRLRAPIHLLPQGE